MSTSDASLIARQKLAWLAVFAVAMGFLEAIVVVYLRELYYPGGFQFPLRPMPGKILMIEMLREGCTIILLVSAAAIASRVLILRFSAFLFTFGIWDIFYYTALKILLDWPSSLLAWDILFLMPVAWVGPVLAPVIVSVTMICFGLVLEYLYSTCGAVRTGPLPWGLMVSGALTIFLTFAWDFGKLITQGGFLQDIFHLSQNIPFQIAVSGFMPRHYSWGFFFLGEALLVSGAWIVYARSRSYRMPPA